MNDGGPAFPVAENHKVADDIAWTCGMTLRDYFAAKAMQALIGEQQSLSDMLSAHAAAHVNLPQFVAVMALKYADAMLKERAK